VFSYLLKICLFFLKKIVSEKIEIYIYIYIYIYIISNFFFCVFMILKIILKILF
jgi:hypothetical protein